MALTVDLVSAQFARAQAFSDQATKNAATLIAQLGVMAAGISPPTFMDASSAPTLPPAPTSTTLSSLNSVAFQPIIAGSIDQDITAPDTTVVEQALPTSPTLVVVPDVSLTLPSTPAAPTLNLAITQVTAPTIADVGLPSLVSISTPSPITITLPDPPAYIETARPAAPSPYTYTPGEEYASQLLASIGDALRNRLNASTGLAPAVEQAIWDRARTRELKTVLGNQAEIGRTVEATGFALPTGVMAAQLREAQRDYFGKVSELSRDIMIKQADMEQSNTKAAIEQGIALESRLIGYANDIEQRAFGAAQILAENAVAIYNAQLSELRVLQDAYIANANIFKTRADVEISKIEIYKSQIQAESLKVDINRSSIEQYRAQIDASKTKIELYRAQVEAQKTLVEIEQAKVGVFGESVRAYSAQIQGEVARLEIPKTQVAINESQASVYRSQVEAYATVARSRNDTVKTRVDAYGTQIQALNAKVQAFGAKITAEAERVRALTSINSGLLDRDKTLIQRDTAAYNQSIELFRAQVALYEANTKTNIERNKLASDQYFTTRQIASEAAKVGAQVNAQLAASGFSTASVNASQKVGFDVGFNYSGEIADPANPG